MFGDPLPMTVLQHINEGLSEFDLAFWMAWSISSELCPSIFGITSHPYDSNLRGISSVNQPSTLPSIEISLSS